MEGMDHLRPRDEVDDAERMQIRRMIDELKRTWQSDPEMRQLVEDQLELTPEERVDQLRIAAEAFADADAENEVS